MLAAAGPPSTHLVTRAGQDLFEELTEVLLFIWKIVLKIKLSEAHNRDCTPFVIMDKLVLCIHTLRYERFLPQRV